jgi:hypothetical protein
VGRRILEINEAECTWIAGNQQVVRSFAADLGIIAGESMPLDLAILDAVWAAWLEMHVRGQEDPNSIINAFGISFGQLMVDRLGFEWKIVNDAVTEIALFGQPGDIVIYPQNLVARRYMAGTARFFEELAVEMGRSIGRTAGAVDPPRMPAPESPAAAAVAAAPAEAVAPVPATEPAAAPLAVGPGKRQRPGKAVGPGKTAGVAEGGSAKEHLAGPIVPGVVASEPFEEAGAIEGVGLVEPGGGIGRLIRRGTG